MTTLSDGSFDKVDHAKSLTGSEVCTLTVAQRPLDQLSIARNDTSVDEPDENRRVHPRTTEISDAI